MKRFLGVSIILLLLSVSASALTVLQLNLEQLTALSEKVFVGRCVSVEPGKDDSNRSVQTVSFEVSDVLKGEPAKTITFRQLGVEEAGREFGMKPSIRIQGLDREIPRYEVGEEAVVFLSAPGGSGLTAPVGLAQGKFTVFSKGDLKTVMNRDGNRGLFIGSDKSPKMKSLSLTSAQRNLMKAGGGELPYGDFISIVKQLASP